MKKALFSLVAMFSAAVATQAAEVTKTYDMTTSGTPTLGITQNETSHEQSGTNAKTVYVIPSTETLNLDDRFAIDNGATGDVQMRWMWRSSNNAYQNGLAGNWNSKSGNSVTSFNLSILDLYAGDKVTITYAMQSGKPAQLHACTASMVGLTDENDVIVSGTEYTIATDGALDMYVTNNNMAIQSVKIVTTHAAEAIDAPKFTLGVDAENRKVAIEGAKTNTGNGTKTYYTIDGTEPTTASALYSEEITLTAAQATDGKVTVKAITYKDGDANVKSEVASFEVTGIGTKLQLNAPVINITSFEQAKNKLYYPKYTFTSDQSSVIGKPTVEYSYVIGTEAEVSGAEYVANTIGELVVYAKAEGYETASASVVIENFAYNVLDSYDFSQVEEHSETAAGSAQTINGAGTQCYDIDADSFAGLTLSNMKLCWKITANAAYGLYARTGAGSITYNDGLAEGDIIFIQGFNGTQISTTATVSFGQYGSAEKMLVLTPAEDPTNVDAIATEASVAEGIYDLAGQKLNSLQKGVNIINGKKILVK